MRDEKKATPAITRWISVGLALYALMGGSLTLFGWCTPSQRLTDWIGSGISMFPNAAVATICAACALLAQAFQRFQTKRIVATFGGLVAILGGATLFEHVSGMDVGIDALLIDSSWGNRAAVSPGRMGPPASTCFTILGIAQLLSISTRPRVRRAAPGLGLCVCAICLLSIMGYISGADPLFAIAQFTGIAMQTATILLALALGMVAGVPDCEPMRTLSENSAGGLLARRSLPFIVALPIVLGWLRIRGQKVGWFDTAMGTSLLMLLLIVIFSGLMWWWMGAIARHEKALRDAQRRLLLHAADLEATVAERTARLRETVNDLQSFSYSIAHDLRAPLRAMGSFAQLLTEEAASSLNPEAKEYCRRIVVGAGRLDQLITDALNYTQAALEEVPVQRVELTRLIRGLVDTYPNLHSQATDIEVSPDLPAVIGNESLLTQCFSNLLGNAVKFVALGVRPRVRVWSESSDGAARIWVEDNGIGIPKHAQPRLFAMFEKLDNQYEGTGMGLAIVRKVVERMGGKIGVESEPGVGSRFWVELRIAQRREQK
jgi:signal transduction histidine kinase